MILKTKNMTYYMIQSTKKIQSNNKLQRTSGLGNCKKLLFKEPEYLYLLVYSEIIFLNIIY